MDDKKKWGRFFTKKDWVLDIIINLIENGKKILEPCCGIGHIVNKLEQKYSNIIAIDIIKSSCICKKQIQYFNFFDYDISNKFDTIITNPPYVSYRIFDNNVITNWKTCLPKTNLYLYFIEKCFYHLSEFGEMILIIPIDFINNTRGSNLRKLLNKHGTITHIINLCDRKVFSDCSPDVIIIRYQKGNLSHIINYQKTLESTPIKTTDILRNGTYQFNNFEKFKYLKDFFNIKVGLVIGCNHIFEKDTPISVSIITSDYNTTKKRRKFLYLDNLTLDELYKNHVDVYNHLMINKHALLKRKVRKFNETNWWKWGGARNIKYMKGDCDCIYVNQRTRHDNPFFIHKMSFFDGTILCLIPKHKINLQNWIHYLNNNKGHLHYFLRPL